MVLESKYIEGKVDIISRGGGDQKEGNLVHQPLVGG
jgi:hypothetical protein